MLGVWYHNIAKISEAAKRTIKAKTVPLQPIVQHITTKRHTVLRRINSKLCLLSTPKPLTGALYNSFQRTPNLQQQPDGYSIIYPKYIPAQGPLRTEAAARSRGASESFSKARSQARPGGRAAAPVPRSRMAVSIRGPSCGCLCGRNPTILGFVFA